MMRKLALITAWLIGLAFAKISAGHALNYVGHPGSFFFFDSAFPILIILALLIITWHELRSPSRL